MNDEPAKKNRSYGLRSGKRIYVGYNDERKVKDRKKERKAMPRLRDFCQRIFAGEPPATRFVHQQNHLW